MTGSGTGAPWLSIFFYLLVLLSIHALLFHSPSQRVLRERLRLTYFAEFPCSILGAGGPSLSFSADVATASVHALFPV